MTTRLPLAAPDELRPLVCVWEITRACKFGQVCPAGCSTVAQLAAGHTGDNPYCLRRV